MLTLGAWINDCCKSLFHIMISPTSTCSDGCQQSLFAGSHANLFHWYMSILFGQHLTLKASNNKSFALCPKLQTLSWINFTEVIWSFSQNKHAICNDSMTVVSQSHFEMHRVTTKILLFGPHPLIIRF